MPLFANVARTPIALDPARADDVLARLDPVLTGGPRGELLRSAAGSSPHLARLLDRHGPWLTEQVDATPQGALDHLLTEIAAAGEADVALANLRTRLRQAKGRGALLIGLADLGGIWNLEQVTGALTALADTAVESAASWLLMQEITRNRLPGIEAPPAGYVILAMGKMGAHELNYSSDIDLIALFDDSLYDGADVLDARARYIHVTKQLVKILSEQAEGGYVFRTDLRLRPAPSTTPVCMALSAAERYYESVGRTWERAAHIKARPLVDVGAGKTYLDDLTPFIWRRYLDFAAIEDTQEMLRKIRAQKVRFTPGEVPGHDLKLGPGGIREIEFFAQTRQLICGGRDPTLRLPGTVDALEALTAAEWITAETRDTLTADYRALRALEHRIQMIEDQQTHKVPKSDEGRARLAALSGEADVAVFEAGIAELLARVHDTCEELFASEDPPRREATEETRLADLGFKRPGDAARQIARWQRGDIPATRSERGRRLFRQLEPQIIERLAGAADPDQALVHFDRFLSGLPAGVQVFSLFTANAQLSDLIVEICAAAPRLAAYLGRRPQTLDALLDRDFWSPLPRRDALGADLLMRLHGIDDYERGLDETRRWAREQGFRAGLHVLRGVAGAEEAGQSFSVIAETALDQLYPRVMEEFARRHGPPPGEGMSVLAMGKLGSGEMTAGSDLDLITVYDPAGSEESEGPKPLGVTAYYPRLTQALVAALSAQTAEGALYEVDMRLRPSGRKGPVAVSLAAFRRYQLKDAWVWEHMALTRARVVAGPEPLGTEIGQIIAKALSNRAGQDQVLEDAREMRRRVLDATAAERLNPWSLKHAAGGLMEIEFVAQTGRLYCGLEGVRSASVALPLLAAAGWLAEQEAGTLGEALSLHQRLQQIERVALDQPLEPETLGPELREVIVRAAGASGFADLEDRLRYLQVAAAEICARRLEGD